MGATSTSPLTILLISLGLFRILTGPVPIPGDAAAPVKIGAWAVWKFSFDSLLSVRFTAAIVVIGRV